MDKLRKVLSWSSRTILALAVIAFVAWAANTTIRNVNIVNSTGAFTALSDSALTTGCVGNTGGTFDNLNCLPQNNVYFHYKALASNVSNSANTASFIDSYTLPPLSYHCGTNLCRIRVAYSYYIFGGTYGACWATDSTTPWALSSVMGTDTNFATCTSGGQLSSDTFSSGATPVISIYGDNAGTWTACTSPAGASPCTTAPTGFAAVNSSMQVEVVVSN